MRFYLFLFIQLSCNLWSQVPDFPWSTGQILAVSQREAEPATMIFEFITGSRYGHVGLIIVEDNKPWVYEATHPHVKKTSLEDFFKTVSKNNFGSYEYTLLESSKNLTNIEKNKLQDFAQNQLNLKTKYNYSGVTTPGKLNCSEFVHQAFESAGITNVGSYQPMKDLNLDSLSGLIKKIWGNKILNPNSLILSPFSIVTNPNLSIKFSTLPARQILSDKALYEGWINTHSFVKFKERFMLEDDVFTTIEPKLSPLVKARYPIHCNANLL